MARNNMITETSGVMTPDKKRVAKTNRLFHQHYSDELSKVNSLTPTGRMILISQLFSKAQTSGISESAIRIRCNQILGKVGLPLLSDYSYSFLQSNNSLNSVEIDLAIILGVNDVLAEYGESQQYIDESYHRDHSSHDVPIEISELSTNELELIQQARIEKLKERVLDEFFREFPDSYSVLREVCSSIESTEEFLSKSAYSQISAKQRHSFYIDMRNRCLQYFSNRHEYSVLKLHRELSNDEFCKATTSIISGEANNIPREVRQFIIMSVLRSKDAR